jgi:hypothetical protein
MRRWQVTAALVALAGAGALLSVGLDRAPAETEPPRAAGAPGPLPAAPRPVPPSAIPELSAPPLPAPVLRALPPDPAPVTYGCGGAVPEGQPAVECGMG